jgi:hypothetical protein
MIAIFSLLENYFDWDSLHDFHVIAGSIFGWKQTERRAGGARDAVHVTVQGSPSGINVDFGFLPNSHAPQLGLFEIGGDPDFIQGYDREELLPSLYIHSDHYRLVHFAADWGHNPRVFQV